MSSVGKRIRWPELFDRSRPLILAPIDDHLIFGPVAGLERVSSKVESLYRSGVDAVLTFAGCVERSAEAFQGRRFILNLTASSTLSDHTRKVQVSSVEKAVSLGATAIAVHINVASKWAGPMMKQAGELIECADALGVASVGIVYPRSEAKGKDEDFDDLRISSPADYAGLVAHATAIGADLGFDLIKTWNPGDEEAMRTVVDAAGTVPVLVAGGALTSDQELLNRAAQAIRGGAAGVSYGRNFFGRTSPDGLIARIREIYADSHLVQGRSGG